MRVPWTARRSNQSILKEINPAYSLEGLMLMLKLQSFGHQMERADSLEKTLMLGKIDSRRRRGRQKMRWFDGITDSMDMSLSRLWGDNEGQGSGVCCSPWCHKESDTTERLNNNLLKNTQVWISSPRLYLPPPLLAGVTCKPLVFLSCLEHFGFWINSGSLQPTPV